MVKEFKETKAGAFPDDWSIKNIVENSTMKARIGWQGLTVAEYLDRGEYYLVTGTDFFNGRINWEGCHFVDKERYIQDKNIQLKIGDILITKDGTIGKIAFIDKLPLPTTLNSGIFVIRPKHNEYLPQFLFFIFNSFYFRRFLNQLVAGSTITHLYQKDFISFNFPLPPLDEQITMVNVLNDTDDLISNLEKLITKKRDIKQGAMQELLKPKKSWKVRKLGDVLKIKHGKSQKEVISKNGIYPILASGGVIGKARSFLYDKPSVLIGRKGTIDEPQYMDTPFWTVDTLFYTEIYDDYEPKFLYYLFKLVDWYSYNEASGVPSLNAKTIELIEKPFPESKAEQTAIVQILSDMDSEIQELEKKIKKYKFIKQGLMQNLLTGKMRLV